jgi:hypothetical protein
MGVVLKVGRQRAFLRGGEWRCADPVLETQLNQTLQSWIEECGGPALSSADPEADAAREVARRVSGKILMSVPANRRQSQRDYFARRQYKLAFFS